MVKGPTTRARPLHGTFWPDKSWSLEIWQWNTNDQSYLMPFACIQQSLTSWNQSVDSHLIRFRVAPLNHLQDIAVEYSPFSVHRHWSQEFVNFFSPKLVLWVNVRCRRNHPAVYQSIIPTTSSWRACSNRHPWRQTRAWSVMSFRISGYAVVITKWQISTPFRGCRWKLSKVLKGPR